jgi:hypothetical protein
MWAPLIPQDPQVWMHTLPAPFNPLSLSISLSPPRFGRKRAIHVTPTAMVNGIIVDSISSGWGVVEWSEFLDKCIPKTSTGIKRSRESGEKEPSSKSAKM